MIVSFGIMAFNLGLRIQGLLIDGSPFQLKSRASKIKDEPYPKTPVHLIYPARRSARLRLPPQPHAPPSTSPSWMR